MTKLTDEQRELARRLYERGEPVARVCGHARVSRSMLYKLLNGAVRRTLPSHMRKRVVELYRDGVSYREITSALGVSNQTITALLRAEGIEPSRRRRMPEPKKYERRTA